MLAGRSQPAAQHNISSRWFLSSASRKGVMQVARLPVLQPRCADLPQKAVERGRERKKEHNSPPLSSRASQGYTRDTNACVQQVVYVCARAARERKERRRREKRQAQFFPREVQEWERQIIWGISGIGGAQLHIAHKGLPWPRIHARSRSLLGRGISILSPRAALDASDRCHSYFRSFVIFRSDRFQDFTASIFPKLQLTRAERYALLLLLLTFG